MQSSRAVALYYGCASRLNVVTTRTSIRWKALYVPSMAAVEVGYANLWMSLGRSGLARPATVATSHQGRTSGAYV